MSGYHYGAPQHYAPMPSHSSHSHTNHHGRSRRGPRIASQNAHRQFTKAQRSPKEVMPESAGSHHHQAQGQVAYSEYLARLEAAKSFEFDDDELFCPFHLLTEDDLQSIHSTSASDRSSLSSGSPESSPLQTQVQPTPAFLLSSAANSAYGPSPTGFSQQQMKLHQPLAQRSRNAIPIVDPSTRSVASPPLSVSPGRQMQQQYMPRRW